MTAVAVVVIGLVTTSSRGQAGTPTIAVAPAGVRCASTDAGGADSQRPGADAALVPPGDSIRAALPLRHPSPGRPPAGQLECDGDVADQRAQCPALGRRGVIMPERRRRAGHCPLCLRERTRGPGQRRAVGLPGGDKRSPAPSWPRPLPGRQAGGTGSAARHDPGPGRDRRPLLRRLPHEQLHHLQRGQVLHGRPGDDHAPHGRAVSERATAPRALHGPSRAGAYRLALLGDGTDEQGKVLATAGTRVRRDRVGRVAFKISMP